MNIQLGFIYGFHFSEISILSKFRLTKIRLYKQNIKQVTAQIVCTYDRNLNGIYRNGRDIWLQQILSKCT